MTDYNSIIDTIWAEHVEDRRFSLECGLELCESPIEKILLARLFTDLDLIGTGPRVQIYNFSEDDVDDCRPGFNEFFIWPQMPLGKYRVDFGLMSTRGNFVIECDGHDFHERTKKQAARDRSRDRWMTAAGYTVFRFTGSEIHANDAQLLNDLGRAISNLESA
tara:strand:+ start:716 stop:1204 length:489 start_codon:yes stop_codon:yes gene_type:complete